MSATRARLAAKVAGVTLGSAAVGASAAWVGSAAYFARRVLTPDLRRPDDVAVLGVTADTVTLQATPDTVIPGHYGLWFDRNSGHAQVGPVLERDVEGGTLVRQLLRVDVGALRVGPGRWDGYVYSRDPGRDLGLATQHVYVAGELGPMPAWLVPAREPSARWAILVHGRAARREEAMRALPSLHAAGLTCLVPTYRNDEGAMRGPDGRYNLGLSEWRDIDASIRFALEQGASEVILVGWSMGAAIVLQTLHHSSRRACVSRAILDGPVVDWGDVLRHQAQLHGVPSPVGRLGTTLMGVQAARRLVGVHQVVDVAQTDWVRRANELTHPLLVIHSQDDEFVPSGPSQVLAACRPDLVTFESWSLAHHCKEWNVDTARWEKVVRDYVA